MTYAPSQVHTDAEKKGTKGRFSALFTTEAIQDQIRKTKALLDVHSAQLPHCISDRAYTHHGTGKAPTGRDQLLDKLFVGRRCLCQINRAADLASGYPGYQWQEPPTPVITYNAGEQRTAPSPYIEHAYVCAATPADQTRAKSQATALGIQPQYL